ncbi:histidine kinase [Corynebacterium kalidii]|uniref:histidine kinase n=1 Tax=Corynebacterium kalidii TaxID=2931982 RepID=A0A9X1WMY4_9CORY|nr:histidine kinase [Corynebacterium kalidii]MCJ7858001.1 histidine kinase [Corynebacterium kalidii]
MEQPAVTVEAPQGRAPQAQPGPFWRDRGLWLQLVIQSAAFLFFGPMELATSFSDAPPVTGWLLAAGYVLVYVGLLVQRWRAETGLVAVTVGLVVAAGTVSGVYILAYLVVCYEAWFISAFIRRRRGVWLAVLTGGSVGALLYLGLVSWTAYPSWSVMTFIDADGRAYTVPGAQIATMVGALGVFALVSIGLFWQLGLTTRHQYERMESLAARVELAAVAERTRIAREMHDIVAHSLTAVIAQADGGRYAGRQDPAKAIEALDTISATGRDALTQMRQLLSVLRSDPTPGSPGSPGSPGDTADGSRDTSAPPGVSGVPALVEDARRSGLSVDYDVLGNPVQVDVAVGLTVYRTVQECLTNVLKHAGRTRARVVLDWNVPGSLHITVDNAPGDGFIDSADSDDGRGQGLVGLRERARIHGGTAEWGASETFVGGWRVDVRLGV